MDVSLCSFALHKLYFRCSLQQEQSLLISYTFKMMFITTAKMTSSNQYKNKTYVLGEIP